MKLLFALFFLLLGLGIYVSLFDPNLSVGGVKVMDLATVASGLLLLALMIMPVLSFIYGMSSQSAKFSQLNDFRYSFYCPHCHASLGPGSEQNDYNPADGSFRCHSCRKRVK